MDVLAPKIGEIIGGSQQKNEVLERRIQSQGLNPEDLVVVSGFASLWYCPHAGFGLGFEQIGAVMTGMGNIRDVIPFPERPECC